jgi:lipopolysaccharide biosynthesis glycosyltransferase
VTALRESPSAGAAPAADEVAERQPIRVMFCCDPGYYQHLAVALASLLENNRRHALDITIVASARDKDAERRLLGTLPSHPDVEIHVKYFALDRHLALPTSFHITAESYLRILVLDTMPPDCERIIYLDCDLVVLAGLDGLWKTDIGDYAVAAVPDPYGAERSNALGMPEGAAYVNAGVLFINVARWREEGIAARVIDYASHAGSRLEYHDQDAINAVLHGQILTLPFRWNCQAKMFRASKSLAESDRAAIYAATRNPAIVHYTTAQKPWMFTAFMPKRALYQRYLALTGWRDAPPTRRSLGYLPEALFNGVAYILGSSFTFDRFLRTTNVGRVLVRGERLARRLGSFLWSGARPSARASGR